MQGAFAFSVGAPSAGGAVGALEQHLLAGRHPSRALGTLTGALRTLILLAVLVAIGGVAPPGALAGGVGRAELRASCSSAAGAGSGRQRGRGAGPGPVRRR